MGRLSRLVALDLYLSEHFDRFIRSMTLTLTVTVILESVHAIEVCVVAI